MGDSDMNLIYAIHPDYAEIVKQRIIESRKLPREQVEAAMQAAVSSKPVYQSLDGIAVIRIRGIMEKYALWSDETSTILIRRTIQAASNDKDVEAILLAIDSPGGSVDGIAELEDVLFQTRQAKRLVVQVDGLAASAGYWTASQASAIYAHRLDEVGSIGVFMIVDDSSKYFEDKGVKAHLITTGDYKGAGIAGTEITEKQLEHWRGVVNTYYEAFISAINKGRNLLSVEQIKEIADGRIFIGEAAVDNHLIDGIQTFEQTLGILRADLEQARLISQRAGARIALAKAKQPRAPYPSEHACRLNSPDKYDSFARKNCEVKHDGKCIDIIYGIKGKGKDKISEIQAYRYNKDTWTASDARAHCKEHDGIFEAASDKEGSADKRQSS